MRLFYTGASLKDGVQNSPHSSLGGFVSSSVVPNGKANALFPDLDLQDLNDGLEDIIGVVLKNETGATVTNLRVYSVENTDNYGTFELAAVSVNSNGSIEIINDRKSLPYTGTFFNIVGVANERVLVASLDNDAMIGLWIRRIVAPVTQPTCDELFDNATTISDTESLQIVFNYD